MSAEKVWLYRARVDNQVGTFKIFGPFDHGELFAFIDKNTCRVDDEVCRSGDYWFRITSTQDVLRVFGEEHMVRLQHALVRQAETLTDINSTTLLDINVDQNVEAAAHHKELQKLNEGDRTSPSIEHKPRLRDQPLDVVERPAYFKLLLFIAILGLLIALRQIMKLVS